MLPIQEPPEHDLLDQLDCTRLPELQFLSTYCPFTLNAKPCPHGSKCLLKKVCYVSTPYLTHCCSRNTDDVKRSSVLSAPLEVTVMVIIKFLLFVSNS